MTTAEVLGINIPLMVLAFAIWAGVPLWMVLRHPDRDPREARRAESRDDTVRSETAETRDLTLTR